MAIKPVQCPLCGQNIYKTGECSGCRIPLDLSRKIINTSNYHYNIALDKARVRDLTGAIASLETSLMFHKNNVRARNLLGLIYMEMGEIVTALKHFVLSLNVKPEKNIASKYVKLCQDATKLDGANFLAKTYNLALEALQVGNVDLAVMNLKKALMNNSHFLKGLLLISLIYIKNQNYERASVFLGRALKLDRGNAICYRYLNEIGSEISDAPIAELEIDDEEEDAPKKKFDIFKRFVTMKSDGYDVANFVRYSGTYLLMGAALGILLLGFVIIPGKEKSFKQENSKIINRYSEELSSKNSIISSLDSQIEDLNHELEEAHAVKEGEKAPDYSVIKNGMTEEDIEKMIEWE